MSELALGAVGISRWIQQQAEDNANAVALVIAGKDGKSATHATFQELEDAVQRAAAGLSRQGIKPGERVILMVEPGLEFFAAAFALFRIGAVMVGVDPGMGIRRVRKALGRVKPVGFIGNWKAQLARVLFRWGDNTVRLSITAGSPAVHKFLHLLGALRGFRPTALTFETLKQPPSPNDVSHPWQPKAAGNDDAAAILFTSGSTGPAKGVLYTHGLFEAQLDALRNVYSIHTGERELATFPLFALFAPALGMTAVIPRMDFTRPGSADPDHLMDLIKTHSVSSMFGSPALLKRLAGSATAPEPRLDSLRRVVSAGAPVPAELIAKLADALPVAASIHTPYGATEALPVASIDAREILTDTRAATETGQGVCVGTPCRDMEVRILPIDDGALSPQALDEPLPTGTIGEITVRGPVVTATYIDDAQATHIAKLVHPSGLFHRMGDLGYLDSRGRIWFCGRKSERVAPARTELYTATVEAIFNRHPAVARSALVGVLLGGEMQPVVVIELVRRASWDPPIDRRSLVETLLSDASEHPHTAGIRRVLFYRQFPVDPRHNAKIDRPALARWAAGQLT